MINSQNAAEAMESVLRMAARSPRGSRATGSSRCWPSIPRHGPWISRGCSTATADTATSSPASPSTDPVIDLRLIRESPDSIRAALARRGGTTDDTLDEVLRLDEERRSLLQRAEKLKAERNEYIVGFPGLDQSIVEAI